MTIEELAYKLSEWRKRRSVRGEPKWDYSCAEYILRVEPNIPEDDVGLAKLFKYHHEEW
jgi:hypothetical protein